MTTPAPLSGQFALSGPSRPLDPAHWPVRGDLAHIDLAGRCFVPHYAVPMAHRLREGAVLRRTGRDEGEALASLTAGVGFAVLDMASGWAWGQVTGDQVIGGQGNAEAGLVGYLPLPALEAA